MRPLVQRVPFPRPRPPQDGWLQTGSTPPVFDATTVVATAAQQRGWRVGGFRRPPLVVPAVGWWIAETFTPAVFWSAVASQQRAWATLPGRKAFLVRAQDAWWAATLEAFDVTTTVAAAMQQRDWRVRGLRRPPLWAFQEGWWIAETFLPALFAAARLGQQRDWTVLGRRRPPILVWQDAWITANVPPVPLDVTLAMAAIGAMRDFRVARRDPRPRPSLRPPDAWITENVPAVTTEAYRQTIPPGWRRSGERPL